MGAVPRTISRRRRVLVENLTGYAFLLPAAVLIFLFGLFPVVFAFFVSLHRWRRFPDEYVGLANYTRAMGDFAYALFFFAGVGALLAAGVLLWRLRRRSPGWMAAMGLLLAGVVNTAAALLLGQWFFTLLPAVLNIPRKLLGQERIQGLFINELLNSLRLPEVTAAAAPMLVALVAAALVSTWMLRRQGGSAQGLWLATGAALLIALGWLTLELALAAIGAAVEVARAQAVELPIWTQIVLISAGFGLIGAAYVIWTRGVRADGDRRFALAALAAALLLVGGYVLVAEIPRMLASADRDMLSGFSVTIMYAVGAVPFQLAIGLALAYLLFQKLKGTTVFRIIFFMPYIMPFLATAMVFSLLFSHRQNSIINHLIGLVGISPQKWLLEPIGIFRLLFGPTTPDWLAGPGLALVVIIIYTIWTYAGYATVVFLAGLGSIPGELYEAARIDGASGWQIFRRLTLPLLSPTTFFLSLVAVIGTFQAFTQIWMMRTPAAGRSVDTMSIYIFRRITDASPNYGYGAALAFVLFAVILLLTVAQNRLAGRRVFYG